MYVVAPQTNVKTHKRKDLSEVRIEGEREERGEKRSVVEMLRNTNRISLLRRERQEYFRQLFPFLGETLSRQASLTKNVVEWNQLYNRPHPSFLPCLKVQSFGLVFRCMVQNSFSFQGTQSK